jgi:transketolase
MTPQAAAKNAAIDAMSNYKDMANAIRALSMDAVEKANSGHPGMPMGMADVATVLFAKYLKYCPRYPTWPDRDRFVLSAGHGSMLLYSLLYLTGYDRMTLSQIRNFRQLHSLTPGHPEVHQDYGVETTTGPLGQGLSNAVGMALAERILNNRFGDGLVDHYTYVIASDGDLMEGISHESCALAGHLKLHRLVVLYDDNGISIDGPTSLSYSDDVKKRFEAYGWNVQTIDGHNTAQIDAALTAAQRATTPSIICCKTHIGFGAPTKQDSASSHGSPLGEKEIAGARKNLGWHYEPFEIPDEILANWRKAGDRGLREYTAWKKRLDQNRVKDEFEKKLLGDFSAIINPLIADLKKSFATEKPNLATRQTSGKVLQKLVPAITALIGGSADLTGSVNTKIDGPEVISSGNHYNGQYIHYGVREHGMAAIMNGMALHGGVIPYGGTFLTFSDYCRPAIRLAALMKQRVIHVMTHDSIGLGEDGPTHQPVEHLAALRAIPDLRVMRPCDGVETAECWQLALEKRDGPTVMVLTRQGLPTYRTADDGNKTAKGAYVLAGSNNYPDVTIFASGSEVEIAMDARKELEADGINTRVVSVPCMELFFEQDEAYRESLLDNRSLKVAVEAGIRQGWDRFIGRDGIFIGMKSYGESGPYKQLYKLFGISPEAVIMAVRAKRE